MLNKKGFSLVEIIVVTILICGSIAVWYLVLTAGNKQDKIVDQSQQYLSLRSSLMLAVKKDIRSSLKIKEINKSLWEIDIVELNEANLPHLKQVSYYIDADCRKIIRKTKGGIKSYDFSEILKEKKLNFKILP